MQRLRHKVTSIQCFGGSLNLNIHYHMLFLDSASEALNSYFFCLLRLFRVPRFIQFQ